MSIENVKKFYEAVSQDESLKQMFVKLSKKYHGQPMDEVKAMSVMEQEGLPMAAQMGYSFTMDDLKAYEIEMQQANMNCALSDEEMQAVTGGNASAAICLFCGLVAIDKTGWSSYTSGGDFCLFWGFNMNLTGH